MVNNNAATLANESENSLYFSADSSNLRSENDLWSSKNAIAKGYKIYSLMKFLQKDWQQDIKKQYMMKKK